MLSLYDKNAIVQLAFYVPFLVICVFLIIRHGFRSSGPWYFIAILSQMRIVGGSLELATISNPTNIGFYIGSQTLQSTGLSPLLLVSVSIVGRVLASIPDSLRPLVPNKQILRGLRLLIVVGLILAIVGGVQLGNQIVRDIDNGRSLAGYTIPGVIKGGIICLIVSYGLMALFALRLMLLHTCTPHSGVIAPPEWRLLTAVLLALPFVLVRIVYSAMTCFDPSNTNFRLYGGGHDAPYYVIGMCTVMEIVCMLIFLAVGLTLPSTPREERSQRSRQGRSGRTRTKYDNTRVEDTEMATQ